MLIKKLMSLLIFHFLSAIFLFGAPVLAEEQEGKKLNQSLRASASPWMQVSGAPPIGFSENQIAPPYQVFYQLETPISLFRREGTESFFVFGANLGSTRSQLGPLFGLTPGI